jgi:hypothetical protein
MASSGTGHCSLRASDASASRRRSPSGMERPHNARYALEADPPSAHSVAMGFSGLRCERKGLGVQRGRARSFGGACSLGSGAVAEAMDEIGGADADAGSEGAATLVLAAMSSALVRAAASSSLSSRSAKVGREATAPVPVGAQAGRRSHERVGVGQRPVSRIVAPALDRSGYHGRRAKRLPLGLPIINNRGRRNRQVNPRIANSSGGKRNGHPISPSSTL